MKDSSFQKEGTMVIKNKGTWFYFNCFYYLVCMGVLPACRHVCALHTCGALGVQKSASGPLRLELQVAVTPLLQVLGVEPRSSPRTVSMLQPRANALALSASILEVSVCFHFPQSH